MKYFKKFIFSLFFVVTLMALSSCDLSALGTQGPQGEQGIQGEAGKDGIDGQPGKDGQDGTTPHIGANGNWWIGDTDTGVKAQIIIEGDSDVAAPYIGENGNWWIGIVDTKVKAEGSSGKSAYDIYVEAHPEYTKSESEWIEDLINGVLTTNKHIVTFDTGCDAVVAPQEVIHGYKVVKPEDPVRNGYIFDGWYVGDEKWSFIGYSVTEDITLEAKWQISDYLVEYMVCQEGMWYSYTSINHLYGNKIEEPKLEGMSYSIEWYFDETFKEKVDFSSFVVTGNLVLYGKVIYKKYEVLFDTNGGSQVESQMVERYKLVVKPMDPVKEGYEFVCWTNEMGEEWDFDTDNIISNTTLYAKWKNKLTGSKDDFISNVKFDGVLNAYGEHIIHLVFNADGTYNITTDTPMVMVKGLLEKTGNYTFANNTFTLTIDNTEYSTVYNPSLGQYSLTYEIKGSEGNFPVTLYYQKEFVLSGSVPDFGGLTFDLSIHSDGTFLADVTTTIESMNDMFDKTGNWVMENNNFVLSIENNGEVNQYVTYVDQTTGLLCCDYVLYGDRVIEVKLTGSPVKFTGHEEAFNGIDFELKFTSDTECLVDVTLTYSSMNAMFDKSGTYVMENGLIIITVDGKTYTSTFDELSGEYSLVYELVGTDTVLRPELKYNIYQ